MGSQFEKVAVLETKFQFFFLHCFTLESGQFTSKQSGQCLLEEEPFIAGIALQDVLLPSMKSGCLAHISGFLLTSLYSKYLDLVLPRAAYLEQQGNSHELPTKAKSNQ